MVDPTAKPTVDMEPDDLTCQEFVELVTDYLEGALSPSARTRFEAHLLDCDDCPIYLAQMRATILTVGALSEPSLDPAAKTELLTIFREWKRS